GELLRSARWSRTLPPGGQRVGVDGGDDVEQAGHHHELRAVVGGGYLHGGLTEVEDAGEDVEQAVAEVPGEVEDVEQVAGVGGVDLALQGEADTEHGDDRNCKEGAADPFAQHEVACAGDKQACDQNEHRKGR